MVLTPSMMVDLGTPVPNFELPDFNGSLVSSADFVDAQGLLLAVICPHCPFVKHLRIGLAQFARDYIERGLKIIAINANDTATYPADGIDGMREEASQAGYTFPYLIDEKQEVAKTLQAACTPDFFLFNGIGKLVYRGQFDDSRPGSDTPITGVDLRAAADAVLAGDAVSSTQKASIGCSIKWKLGNKPDYFAS